MKQIKQQITRLKAFKRAVEHLEHIINAKVYEKDEYAKRIEEGEESTWISEQVEELTEEIQIYSQVKDDIAKLATK